MTISTRCRALAEQAKVSAKSMHCRANADARAAALKAASVYVMAAGWSETMPPAALAERCREQADAYLASAKPYKAGPKKSAYIRGAAVLFEVARWAEDETPQPRQRRQRQVAPDSAPEFPPSDEYTFGGRYIGPAAEE